MFASPYTLLNCMWSITITRFTNYVRLENTLLLVTKYWCKFIDLYLFNQKYTRCMHKICKVTIFQNFIFSKNSNKEVQVCEIEFGTTLKLWKLVHEIRIQKDVGAKQLLLKILIYHWKMLCYDIFYVLISSPTFVASKYRRHTSHKRVHIGLSFWKEYIYGSLWKCGKTWNPNKIDIKLFFYLAIFVWFKQ